jgi:(p)ppGpp synthase/HD superfamily hydrolase
MTSDTFSARPYPVKPSRDERFVRLGKRFDRALAYAARMHREQARKASPVPYLAHLLGVASLVLEYGGDQNQAIAALLHDTVEDCPGDQARQIKRRFGKDVLAMVRACSDSDAGGGEKAPWRGRKQDYIDHLGGLPAGHRALLVSACDKLHNARSIRADLRQVGLPLWDRFSAPAPDQLWYYRSLVDGFARNLGGPVVDELRRTVDDIERLDRELRDASETAAEDRSERTAQ